jgi:uncharacterized membrane protein
MLWRTFTAILQAIILVPLFFVVVYLGFWIAMMAVPLLVGAGVVGLLYWLIVEYRAYKKEEHEN